MEEVIRILGLVFGCVSLLFGALAGVTYYKLKQFLELITEDQVEQAAPIIDKQKRRICIYLVACSVFTVATFIMSFIL